jgi:hypothetical protein
MLVSFDHSGVGRFGALAVVGFGQSSASATLVAPAPATRAVPHYSGSDWLWPAAPLAMMVLARDMAAVGSAAMCRHFFEFIY